ncbi:MAG: hypothetical protein WKF65_08660 [Gaiellaceae bacterium]
MFSTVPIHYRAKGRGWQKIKHRLVGSSKGDFEWANEEAGFKADLKQEARGSVVWFETGDAGSTLALEDATPSRGSKETETGVVYKNVFRLFFGAYARATNAARGGSRRPTRRGLQSVFRTSRREVANGV